MYRRDLLVWIAKLSAGAAVFGSRAEAAPLRRINAVQLGAREAAAGDCGEDHCATRDACQSGDAGHVCHQRDVCDVDESGDCTRDECTTDKSGVCTDDSCVSDSSKACTGDACVSDASGSCSGDACSGDSSGDCVTADQCVSDSSGGCETSDVCRNDASGACTSDSCSADSSGACLPGDTCISDSSGACQADECISDKSGACIHDQCASDSSKGCESDVCIADSSGSCTADQCRSDSSGMCTVFDTCSSDASGQCEADGCRDDASGECHGDRCGADSSDVCTVADVCVADKSGPCGSDLCRTDGSVTCTTDTCAPDLAAVLTRRSFTRLNRALRWLYEIGACLLLAALAWPAAAQLAVNTGCSTAFYPRVTIATAQPASAGSPKGPFLADWDGDGVLEADVDGNGFSAADPEVKDYDGDGTRELPAGARFEGTRTYTVFWIPDDVAITTTGYLKVTASTDAHVFGVLRLAAGAEIAAVGVVDVRSSAWLAESGEVRLSSALAAGAGEYCDGLDDATEGLGRVLDTDLDGADDTDEGTADTDSDGVPDWQDQDTVRIPSATGAGAVALDVAEGRAQRLDLSRARALLATDASLPAAGRPSGQFPYGVLSFWVVGLDAGESVTVTLRFPAAVPSTAQFWIADALGWYQVLLGSHDGDATLTLAVTDGGAGDTDGRVDGVVTVAGGVVLGGTGLAVPLISASTSLHNFGNVPRGSVADKAITVRNAGGADLAIGSVGALNPLDAPFTFSPDGCSGTTLAPGASCLLVVRFAPDAVRPWSDSFDIPSSDPSHARIFVTILGTGATPPRLVDDLADEDRLLYVIPAAAHKRGLEQTRWLTDAVLHNRDSMSASVTLYFLKEKEDNSAAAARVVTVPGLSSLRLADIVESTFGESSSSGAIVVAADASLTITSRTYNDAASGTYGQYIGGLPALQAVSQWEPARLLQLTSTASYRTNVGFASLATAAIQVNVELRKADGTRIGTRTYTLKPLEYFQETDIIGDLTSAAVTDAYAIVSSPSGGARYFAYASVVDNRTGDPINVVPARPLEGLVFVPSTAHLRGNLGTNWRTDLEVHNPGDGRVSYLVALLKRDADNSSPQEKSFSLEGGKSVRYEDVLQGLFSYSGAATLRITSSDGPLLVTARTYNDQPDGTYGQFIPGALVLQPIPWELELQATVAADIGIEAQSADDGIIWGQEARLVQLAQSASAAEGFRTNLGLVSVCDRTQILEVTLYRGDGTVLGVRSYTLRPFESKQADKIFQLVTPQEVADGFAVVRTTTPGASFLAYASVVDNKSGDPTYVPARVAGALQ